MTECERGARANFRVVRVGVNRETALVRSRQAIRSCAARSPQAGAGVDGSEIVDLLLGVEPGRLRILPDLR